jgi:hypothetical protein
MSTSRNRPKPDGYPFNEGASIEERDQAIRQIKGTWQKMHEAGNDEKGPLPLRQLFAPRIGAWRSGRMLGPRSHVDREALERCANFVADGLSFGDLARTS